MSQTMRYSCLVKWIIRLFSVAFVLHHQSILSADNSLDKTYNTFHINATHLRLLPHSRQIHANRGLSIRTSFASIYGDSATFYSDINSIIIEHPYLKLFRHRITMDGLFLTLSSPNNAFYIYQPHVLFEKLHFSIKGLYGSCQAQQCEFYDTTINLCTQTQLTVISRKTILHKSQYIDFHDVQLSSGGHQLFKIHFLRLTPTHKAGLLAPIAGFSDTSGFVFGSGGAIPLSPEGSLSGHVLLRSRIGLETRSSIDTNDFHLTLHHLQSGSPNFWLNGSLSETNHLKFFSDIDWVSSDRHVIEELSFHPEQRYIPQLASRLRIEFSIPLVLFESHANLIIPFAHDGELFEDKYYSTLGLHLSIPDTRILGSLFFRLISQLDRVYVPSQLSGSTLDNQALSFFTFLPSLIFSKRISFVQLQAFLHSQLFFAFSSPISSGVFHRLSAQYFLSFPFSRQFKSCIHIFSPKIFYQQVLFSVSSLSSSYSTFLPIIPTNRISVGGYSTLTSKKQLDSIRLDISQIFLSNSFDHRLEPSYSHALIRIRILHTLFSFDASFDNNLDKISFWGFSINQTNEGTTIESGIRLIGKGNGSHLDSSIEESPFPFISSNNYFFSPQTRSETHHSLNIPLSKNISFMSAFSFNILPQVNINSIFYGIKFSPSCAWFHASIVSSHRPKSFIPEIFFQIRVDPKFL